MNPSKQNIIKFLEKRFDSVLNAPLSFGSLLSAELTFYFTLETYLYSVFGTSEEKTGDHYDLFLRMQFGDNQSSLSSCIEKNNYHLSDIEQADILSNLLKQFKNTVYQKELKKHAGTKRIKNKVLIEPHPRGKTQKIIVK